MPRHCLLDVLPVEICHVLFSYFLAHEILLAFSDLSDYVDGIILAYPVWQLNLKSIRRDHFDLICERIQPSQVISLTLSDDDDTPGQSELFFQRFRIEQFSHLRCLTLLKIEYESLENVFSTLDKLEQLISLSFDHDSITYKYPASIHDYSNKTKHINSIRSNSFTRVFPRLIRLCQNDSFELLSTSLPKLRRLKMTKCWHDQLKTILESAPNLQTLGVCLHLEYPDRPMNLTSSQLTRLHLEIECQSINLVSMNQIEEFLPNLPQLRHLELILTGGNDLLDGYRWQQLTYLFTTFNFKFKVNSLSSQLDSFETPFWLEEKHWYTMYHNSYLLSVPRFLPTHIDLKSSAYPIETKYYNSMTINTHIPLMDVVPFFPRIERLKIHRSIPLDRLSSFIDLKQVKHLFLNTITDLLEFQPFESTILNVDRLEIFYKVSIDDMMQLQGVQLKQIRMLNVSLRDDYEEFLLRGLIYCFPQIEYLVYRLNKDSIKIITKTMDQFQHLTNASFHYFDVNKLSSLHSIIPNSHRVNEKNATCRIRNRSVHYWIAPQVSHHDVSQQSSSAVQWPSRLDFIRTRINYFFSPRGLEVNRQMMIGFSVLCIYFEAFGIVFGLFLIQYGESSSVIRLVAIGLSSLITLAFGACYLAQVIDYTEKRMPWPMRPYILLIAFFGAVLYFLNMISTRTKRFLIGNWIIEYYRS